MVSVTRHNGGGQRAVSQDQVDFEAARLDGANAGRILFEVTSKGARPDMYLGADPPASPDSGAQRAPCLPGAGADAVSGICLTYNSD